MILGGEREGLFHGCFRGKTHVANTRYGMPRRSGCSRAVRRRHRSVRSERRRGKIDGVILETSVNVKGRRGSRMRMV